MRYATVSMCIRNFLSMDRITEKERESKRRKKATSLNFYYIKKQANYTN